MRALRAVRSAFSLLCILAYFATVGLLVLYLGLIPAVFLLPKRRQALVAAYMKLMSGGIFLCLRLGGARFTRIGRLPTGTPILVLMNHQSLIDIITIVMMSSPYVPAFVTRARYARFVPVIAPTVRLLRCPIVDPKRARKAAVEAIARAAKAGDRSILIFPEGHRSTDGTIQPFQPAGTLVALRARPVPVWLVVSDGLWVSRRFVDFVFNIHRVHGRTEVMGPFEPPAENDALPAFLSACRDRMIARLEEMRRRDEPGS